MPYTPPATTPATTPALSPSKSSAFLNINYNSWKTFGNFKNKKEDVAAYDRDSAIQEVKDILSTSPKLSTSPRRKSAPESYSRKFGLKVNLPLPLSQELPLIIRKKSGEVVKPSLKKGCSKSEPATPTFPKYVHFNTDLEQIRLFNEAQRPQAISADVSSDEETDDDDDLVFFASDDDDDDDDDAVDSELIISLPNRPMITTLHSSKPVFVESIFLSQDKKRLQGRVMVQNIAFQKIVNIRYTFDFWSTVSEVSASYAEGVPSKDNKNNFDVFIFTIELIDNSRNPIDGKTMYFAVHYSVDNLDLWDNNNGSNYQVNFKRMKPPTALTSKKQKNNSQSTLSKWSMSSIPRPDKNLDESFCRSPPTLDSSSRSLNVPDSRKKLLGRYDIGVSLSAAQNASRSSSSVSMNTPFTFQSPYFSSTVSYNNENFNTFFPNNCIDGMPCTSDTPVIGFEPLKQNSNPIAIPSKPSIGSSSYYDLVNQYCFYSGSPYATNNSYTNSPPVMT